MKKIMLPIASLFLVTSVASANSTSKMDMLSMSKADSGFLFNGKVNTIALSGQEMKKTEGEFWFVAIRFVAFAAIRYYAYGQYNQGHPINGGGGNWCW